MRWDEIRWDERSRVEEKIREWISKARRIDDKSRKLYNAERWTSRFRTTRWFAIDVLNMTQLHVRSLQIKANQMRFFSRKMSYFRSPSYRLQSVLLLIVPPLPCCLIHYVLLYCTYVSLSVILQMIHLKNHEWNPHTWRQFTTQSMVTTFISTLETGRRPSLCKQPSTADNSKARRFTFDDTLFCWLDFFLSVLLPVICRLPISLNVTQSTITASIP